jgi:hypothetical protein
MNINFFSTPSAQRFSLTATSRRGYMFLAVAAVSLLTSVAGCQSSHDARQAKDAWSPDQAQAGSARLQQVSDTSGGSLKSVSLPDPAFGIEGSEVQVPAGWHAQGKVALSPCTSVPSATWEASSSDGQTELIVLPFFGWKWGRPAQFATGCIPLHTSMNAMDFLQQFMGRMHGVRVQGTMEVSEAYRQREVNFTTGLNNNSARLAPPLRARTVGDLAAIHAIDGGGEELRVRAWTECNTRADGGDCFARVDILRAPKGRLNALIALVDGHNLVQEHPTQQWLAAFARNQQQIAAGQMDTLRRKADAGSKMLYDQHVSSSKRLADEHQAGMEQLQRSTDSSMANANANMRARSTSASDMVDYSLNQQTVSGANGTYKTSSQFSNVWSSPYGPPLSDGRTFGSTDNTLNPNTATDNTFTQDQKVHGNGKPQ